MTFESPVSLRTEIEAAAEMVLRGGVVAFPTDTVYGIGCHFQIEEAAERIYDIKGRAKDKPLQLILPHVSDVRLVARDIPDIFWRLAESLLPGGLTLILTKADSVPSSITSGGETVAVRVPNSPIVRSLALAVGVPLAATSANLSGMPSPTTAQEVREQLGDRVDMIIDGGPTDLGKESTILDLTSRPPAILREGAISVDAVRRICPEVRV